MSDKFTDIRGRKFEDGYQTVQPDKWDDKAAELLPCEHTENKPGYFGYNREQSECYGCIHRPAVAAELRLMDAQIEIYKAAWNRAAAKARSQ